MKTIDKILDILKLEKTAEKLYIHLAELEINGKIDSKEYKEYVDLISYTRKFINKHLNEITLNDKDLIDYTDNLMHIFRLEEVDFIIQLITSKQNNAQIRLINDLTYLAVDRKAIYVDDEIPEEYKKMIDNFDDEDEDEDKNLMDEIDQEYNDEMYEIDKLNDQLLSNIMMDYVIDLIEKEQDPSLKKELIYYKYRLIYLFRYLEMNLIKNEKPTTYTQVYIELLKFYFKEDSLLFEDEIIEAVKHNIEYELEDLVNFKESELKDKFTLLEYKLRIIYIKTRLSMLYDQDTIAYFDRIKELIKKQNKSDIANKLIDESYNLKKELSLRNNLDL